MGRLRQSPQGSVIILRRLLFSVAPVCLAAGVASGCSGSTAPTPGPPQGTVAVAGVEMAFMPNALQLRRGTWNVHFENHGRLFHDLTIEPSDGSKVIAATAA